MKIANEKGITIVALLITIIVLLILVGVTTFSGGNIIRKVNLQSINTNMMLIQAKVKTIEEQAKFNKDTSGYKGTPINNVMDDEHINKLKNAEIVGDGTDYYLLSEADLINMGLEKINIEQGYVVNYTTSEVIYVKGFKNGEKTYYKLSEMRGLVIE